MKIYTLVLDTVNNGLSMCSYTHKDKAISDLKVLARQYPLYHEANVPGLVFSANLDEKGSKAYIKECELIGGDHEAT